MTTTPETPAPVEPLPASGPASGPAAGGYAQPRTVRAPYPYRGLDPVTSATTGAAAATAVLCWAAGLAGLDVPADIQGAVTVLIVLAAGWLVPTRSGSHTA